MKSFFRQRIGFVAFDVSRNSVGAPPANTVQPHIVRSGYGASLFVLVVSAGCLPLSSPSAVEEEGENVVASDSMAMPEESTGNSSTQLKSQPGLIPNAIDVDPGAAKTVGLREGYQIDPPEGFRVFVYEESEDFQDREAHFRWETRAEDGWFSVTFDGGRAFKRAGVPKLSDPAILKERIRENFARVDPSHEMKFKASSETKLGEIPALRCSIEGKMAGEPWNGIIYFVTLKDQLIEVAMGVSNRGSTSITKCRKAAETLKKP